MRLGSLCSGYGGLDLAVEAHYGATTVWHAETDEDCSKVLAGHWPGIPNHGDLKITDWTQVEPVDVLAAGYPCQPYSTAGPRLGDEDDRAIFHYIADAISVLRPRIVVLENVAAHTSLGGPGVVGTLAGLGFDLRWGVVRASDAGAPHRRARWWCIATDSEGAERREPEHETVAQTAQQTAESGECSSPIVWDRYEPAVRRWERILGRRVPAPVTDGRLDPAFVEWLMGLSEGWVCDANLSRNAKLKMLGNGICLPQARLALQLLAERKTG